MKRDAFIGREDALAFIVNWLQGEKPLLILHGPGGIGKSRLAVESIRRVTTNFAGNIFGVALDEEFGADPTTVTPEQLAATIARTVSAPKEVLQNPLPHLIPFLKTRPKTLIFLDNGESVFNNDTVPWFARIVQEMPNVRWLVTSRHYPGLSPLAEGYEVPSLPVPQQETDLETSDLYQLFKARIELQHPAPDISDTHFLKRVLRYTDGFPLAVELIAARCGFQTLVEIASGLEQSRLEHQRILKEVGQYWAGSERHASMESCIHWSVGMLPPDDQRFYTRLGIFTFDFDAAATQEIAEVSLPHLMRWQSLHLLERIEAGNATRYLLLPVFREYARQRQQRDFPNEIPVYEPRYTHYYATLSENNQNINLPVQKAILDREWRNALDAAELAARAEDWPTLAKIVAGLRVFLYISVYVGEAVRLQKLGEQTASIARDILGQANCTFSLGEIMLRRSNYTEAKEFSERALFLYEQAGTISGQANCIQILGQIALRCSDYQEAKKRFEQTLLMYQQIGDAGGQANSIFRLGHLAFARSEYGEASQYFEKALPIYEKTEDTLGQANCIFSIGDIAHRFSDYEKARLHFEQALSKYKKVGDVVGQANSIHRLGDIEFRHSNYEGAKKYFDRVLPMYEQVGDVAGQANSAFSLGQIALRCSDYLEATKHFEGALSMFRQAEDVAGQANCIKCLGDIAMEHSDYGEAKKRYEQALPMYKHAGHILGQANSIHRLGEIALACSNHAEASKYFQQALPMYQKVGSVLGQANSIRSLGELALTLNQTERARTLFQQASQFYQQLPDPYFIGVSHYLLSQTADTSEERQVHQAAARTLWTQIDAPYLLSFLDPEEPE